MKLKKVIWDAYKRLLRVSVIAVILSAFAGGWYLGKEYKENNICGDIEFYFGGGKDGDLVKVRDCVEK